MKFIIHSQKFFTLSKICIQLLKTFVTTSKSLYCKSLNILFTMMINDYKFVIKFAYQMFIKNIISWGYQLIIFNFVKKVSIAINKKLKACIEKRKDRYRRLCFIILSEMWITMYSWKNNEITLFTNLMTNSAYIIIWQSAIIYKFMSNYLIDLFRLYDEISS